MNIHKDARLTPLRREEMALSVIEGGAPHSQAALKYVVTVKVVTRWIERYKAEGRAGMADRSIEQKGEDFRPDRCEVAMILYFR